MARSVGRGVGGTVVVHGLDELIRDMAKAQKGIRPTIRKEMKGVAGIVSTAAQMIATARGLVDSGKLVSGIKPAVKGSAGIVRESARRGSFPYPIVYEYGGRGQPARPFMEPAAAAKQGEVEDALADVLDRVLAASNLA